MKAILMLAACAALFVPSAASAVVMNFHVEGTVIGPVAGGFVYFGGPIDVDGSIDTSKGTHTIAPPTDRVEGGGSNAPVNADVTLDFLSGADWGQMFSSFAFVDGPGHSTMSLAMLDPTSTYTMFFVVTRPGDQFTSLTTIPTGDLCVGATACFGKIVDANGGTQFSNANIAVTSFTMRNAVPEPSTWAMMIIGFVGAGAMLRRRRSPAYA